MRQLHGLDPALCEVVADDVTRVTRLIRLVEERTGVDDVAVTLGKIIVIAEVKSKDLFPNMF